MIFLGLDCGTQSTRALALDWETGIVLAVASQAHSSLISRPDGTMEQNPSEWVAAAEASLTEVIAALGTQRDRVRGIGVSGQQHGLVLLNAKGDVIRRAKLWCDTSTTKQCADLTARLGGVEAVIREIGNTMRPGYTAPKIAWVYEHEPENWASTESVLLPHDYLNFWLTGAKSMEYGDASGTALLDISRRQWSTRVVEAVAPGLYEKLPPLHSSHEPAGILRTALASRWGLASNVMVSAGSGDNMMSAIGTGNVRPGIVTASLGTSGTLFAFSPVPFVDPVGEIAGFCDATDNWLPLVCTMNLTLVTEHVRHLFGWDFARLDEEIRSVPAGAGGLVFLPYLVGERTPDLPAATGTLAGLTLQNFQPAYLARAAMESVTFGLAAGLQRLTTIQPEEVRLTGGGSNSPVWRQICADIFGVPTVQAANEGAAFGAALHAGWTTTPDESLTAITDRLVHVNEATRCLPRPEFAESYLKATQKSASLLAALRAGGQL
ncbi:MAG: xylulokinase [Chthoniobacterales bacterium]